MMPLCSPCHRRSSMTIIVAIATCTWFLQLTETQAYSFASCHHRSKLQQMNIKSFPLLEASAPSTAIARRSSASLAMKRDPSRRRRRAAAAEDGKYADPSALEAPELPANLRRPVDARRPVLGHVVPKNSNTRRFKLMTEARAGSSGAAQLQPQGRSRDARRYNNPSNLRILGGAVRGRRLASPDVYLRPMMGKVREAVFSTFTSFGLYDEVGEAACRTRHLDIFR